jgi:hypothetical protein
VFWILPTRNSLLSGIPWEQGRKQAIFLLSSAESLISARIPQFFLGGRELAGNFRFSS